MSDNLGALRLRLTGDMDRQRAATRYYGATTDDPEAAVAVFGQVLAEAEAAAAVGVAAGIACLDPQAALHSLEARFRQVVALADGLIALVWRVMEAFDEDTWPDYLRDCAEAERLAEMAGERELLEEQAAERLWDMRHDEMGERVASGEFDGAGMPFGQDDGEYGRACECPAPDCQAHGYDHESGSF